MGSLKKAFSLFLVLSVFALIPAVSFAGQPELYARNACNPCGKNACNPCGKRMKNACNPCGKNACNPCGKRMKNACNPCNPCGDKPPKPIRSKHISSYSKLLAKGEKLWNTESLGNSGQTCMGCHDDYENFEETASKPFPHFVSMPKDIVTLDQMINFCILNPMDGKMINANSLEMTAMSAFFNEYIKSYKKSANACNPCAKKMRNACNPCGKR